MPGGNNGWAPKPMVRFVTAVPMGTPGKSLAVRCGPLKKITLRDFATATSMLNTVASGIRCKRMQVPSRSATAITKRAREPIGNRMTARRGWPRHRRVDDALHFVLGEAAQRSGARGHQVAFGRRPGAAHGPSDVACRRPIPLHIRRAWWFD